MESKNPKTEQFKTLYKSYKHKIYRLCYGNLYDKGEIEDLFQQVLLNIWENLDSFRGDAQLSTWVYRVTVNTAITYVKKQQRMVSTQQFESDIIVAGDEELKEPQCDPLPELRQLHECIHKLKKQDRIIITLYLEDLSYEQIADVVGISVNYTGVKINRIKNKLQHLMEGP